MSDNNETKVEQEPQATTEPAVEVEKDEQPMCEMRAKMYGESFLYMVDKNGFSALVPVHKIDQVTSEPGANTTSVIANGKRMIYHDSAFIGKIAFALDNRSGMIISAPRTPVIASDHKAVLDYWAKKAEERESCTCRRVTFGEFLAELQKHELGLGEKVPDETKAGLSSADAAKIEGEDKVRVSAPSEWVVVEGDLTASGKDDEAVDYCSSTSTATECSEGESDEEGEEGVDYISLDKLTPELLAEHHAHVTRMFGGETVTRWTVPEMTAEFLAEHNMKVAEEFRCGSAKVVVITDAGTTGARDPRTPAEEKK